MRTQHSRTSHTPSPGCHEHGHCLLLHEARLCVARSTLVTVFMQGFGLLRESLKIFFACGGLRVRRHNAWLPRCCLPAADRVLWLRFRRCGFHFCNVACVGVVSLMCGIYPHAPVDTGPPVSSRRRAGCGAPHTTAARAVLFACGRRLLPPQSSNLVQYATGAFSGRSRRWLVAV